MTIPEFDEKNIIDIDVWENEGGALYSSSMHHHYGRRIERNGSWTVYHVYTGVAAEVGTRAATGLDEATATRMMISLNAGNTERRRAATAKRALINSPPIEWPWGG